LVPSFEFAVADFDGGPIFSRWEHCVAHLTLLIFEREATTDLGRGQELGYEQRALQLFVLQRTTDVSTVLLGRRTNLREAGERERLAIHTIDLKSLLTTDSFLET